MQGVRISRLAIMICTQKVIIAAVDGDHGETRGQDGNIRAHRSIKVLVFCSVSRQCRSRISSDWRSYRCSARFRGSGHFE